MTTVHSAFEFIAGDDWEIIATLIDETGAPYDLTSVTIKWIMYGSSTPEHVLDNGDYALSILDAAAGICRIVVLATRTTLIKGGQYRDALRIVSGGVTSTLATGAVYVFDDPWGVQPAPWAAQSAPGRMKLVAGGK